ncbi:hypothetical protein ACDZ29_09145 [Peribacillus sp. RS7]|uniref:hypothetical protein n=1 Tax=Peribacillus sp. RS7 TaxID=3242679 RepID=UPI0035C1BF6E
MNLCCLLVSLGRLLVSLRFLLVNSCCFLISVMNLLLGGALTQVLEDFSEVWGNYSRNCAIFLKFRAFTREFVLFTREFGAFTREFVLFTREFGAFTREFVRLLVNLRFLLVNSCCFLISVMNLLLVGALIQVLGDLAEFGAITHEIVRYS